MTNLRRVKIDRIIRSTSARSLNSETIEWLKNSVNRSGLLHPITVRENGESYDLIAGGHRLEAVRQLDLVEVDCIVISASDLEAELASIDENLCRAELSGIEFDKHVARRKAIYEELHPETKHGAIGGGRMLSRQVGDPEKADRFSADTATATGKSERSIQRAAERGEKITGDVVELIRGTQLDTGVFLDEIKDLSPANQLERVTTELGIAEENQSDATAAKGRAGTRKRSERVRPADKIQTFMKLADRIERLNLAELVEASAEDRPMLSARASALINHLDGVLQALASHQEPLRLLGFHND